MCGPSYCMYALYMHRQNICTQAHIYLQYIDSQTLMNSYGQVNLHSPVSQQRDWDGTECNNRVSSVGGTKSGERQA